MLIVAKETVNNNVPLCMGLGEEGNKARLRPCFKDDVPEMLSLSWEAGAIIIEEICPNRWDIGPCSSDGELKRKQAMKSFFGLHTKEMIHLLCLHTKERINSS